MILNFAVVGNGDQVPRRGHWFGVLYTLVPIPNRVALHPVAWVLSQTVIWGRYVEEDPVQPGAQHKFPRLTRSSLRHPTGAWDVREQYLGVLLHGQFGQAIGRGEVST